MIPRILWSVSSRWPCDSLFNLEGIPLQDGIGYGGLAQLGERLPCKQEVSGSIPLISTKHKGFGDIRGNQIWANSSAG